MIQIPQPAMAMNAKNVPFPWYAMTNTWKVMEDVAPSHLLGWASVVFKDFKTKIPNQQSTLIINCHNLQDGDGGGVAGLEIGLGIKESDVVHFEKLAGLVDKIYIISCNAAQSITGMAKGDRFVSSIARAAKANVIASSAIQKGKGAETKGFMPFGYIDDIEGDVFSYDREGSVVGVKLGK